jgi:hypothetical protein
MVFFFPKTFGGFIYKILYTQREKGRLVKWERSLGMMAKNLDKTVGEMLC